MWRFRKREAIYRELDWFAAKKLALSSSTRLDPLGLIHSAWLAVARWFAPIGGGELD